MSSRDVKSDVTEGTWVAWRDLAMAVQMPHGERERLLGVLAEALVSAEPGSLATDGRVEAGLRGIAAELAKHQPRLTAGAVLAPQYGRVVGVVLLGSLATVIAVNIIQRWSNSAQGWASSAWLAGVLCMMAAQVIAILQTRARLGRRWDFLVGGRCVSCGFRGGDAGAGAYHCPECGCVNLSAEVLGEVRVVRGGEARAV